MSAEVSTSRREVIESYICPGQEPASYVAESLLSARRGGERDLAEIDPDVAGNTTILYCNTARTVHTAAVSLTAYLQL